MIMELEPSVVRASLGLGPSDVASVLYESPWQEAYELWRIKTGRQEKPEQTDAMKFGAQMEPVAFAAYLDASGTARDQWRTQVAAAHPSLAYFRGIADGWSEVLRQGVEIKVPTSRHLLDDMERGEVPRHYLLQIAGEMAIFGVETWDFYVYDAEHKRGDLVTISFDEEFDLGVTLREFWEREAIPQIEQFWAAVSADKWEFDSAPHQFEEEFEEAWQRACEERDRAAMRIQAAEAEKARADAALKRLMRHAKRCECRGRCGEWTYFRPLYRVTVSAQNDEVLQKIYSALAPMKNTEGVRDVKTAVLPETYRFVLRQCAKSRC